MKKMKPSGVEWIGDIPQEWEVRKLKYVSDFKQIKYAEEYGDLNYIGLENIISWNGMYLETSSQYDREQSLICEENDILFGKLRPYLAKVYLNTKRQCCSSEFCVIKILENHTKYFWYQLISHGFIFMVDRSTYGTKMPRANSDFIRSLYVNIPPLTEQQRIAEFLDRKCAEIDSIIAKTKATIEQYKALKQSVITQAVTKGIRPDRSMKDSGIEWIGEIPQEWEVSRVKYVSVFQPFCDTSSLNDESLITYTPMDCIKNGYFTNNTSEFGKLSSSLTAYQECDIVMAKVTPCFENGNISIMTNLSSGFGLGSSELFVFRAYKIMTKYLFYWLRNKRFINAACATMTGTGGLKRVSPYFVANSCVCVPSTIEQNEIADYLDRKCAEIDRLIAAKEQLLTELESYKKSVIYEYVTGKKEV